MSPYFKTRMDADELMDLPSTSREDFTEALHDIQWVNRNLRGTELILQAVLQLLPRQPQQPIRILDLGTGSADIPKAFIHWGRQHGISFEIVAVDLHPIAVEVSQQETRDYPEIKVVQGDALHLPDNDSSFDIVVSSLFMHHLRDEEAVRLLQEMARLCRIGFVINDLERHPLAYWSIRLVGLLLGKGKVFQHDAPLSVLRGFTRSDIESLRRQAQLPTLQIQRRKPYRLLLTYRKQAL